MSRLSTKAWQSAKKRIIDRDKKCMWRGCKTIVGLHIHHKVPYNISYDDSDENLIALCPRHHYEADWIYDLTGRIANNITIFKGR